MATQLKRHPLALMATFGGRLTDWNPIKLRLLQLNTRVYATLNYLAADIDVF